MVDNGGSKLPRLGSVSIRKGVWGQVAHLEGSMGHYHCADPSVIGGQLVMSWQAIGWVHGHLHLLAVDVAERAVGGW